MKSKFVAVKLQRIDVRRIDEMKIHKTEPRWSVVERAVNNLVELHRKKFDAKKAIS